MSATYNLNTFDSSVNIHINSADSDAVIGTGVDSNIPSTSDFTIVLEDTIMSDEEVSILVSLENVSIPYSFYNVSLALVNNKFHLQEQGHASVLITIPSRNYDVDSMMQTLPALLTAASAVNATYDMSYNESLFKFTFTSSQNTIFSFDFSSDAGITNNQAGSLLGFFKTNNSSQIINSINTLTGHSVNFNTVPFILIDSEFGTRGAIVTSALSDRTTFMTGVLGKIQVNEDFGEMINYTPQGNRHTLVLNRKRIHNLRITARDPQFNAIDLNGAFMSLTLTIDYVNFGLTQGIEEDPREKNHLSTREEINEVLQQTLQQQGKVLGDELEDRNKLIQVLNNQ